MDQIALSLSKLADVIRQSGFWGWAIALVSYFIPAVIAGIRQHKNTVPIFIINLFLGWTFVGWVVALAWSLTYQSRNVIKEQ
jgi:hypothetical protein